MTKLIPLLSAVVLSVLLLPGFAQQTEQTTASETPTLAPSSGTSVLSIPRRSIGVELLGLGQKATIQFEQPIGKYAIGGYASYFYGKNVSSVGITGNGAQLSPYFRYYRGNGKGFYAQGKTIFAWQQGPTLAGGLNKPDFSNVAISSEAASKNHFGLGGGLAIGYKNTLFRNRFYYDANIGVQYIQGLPAPTEPVKSAVVQEGDVSTVTNSSTTAPTGRHHGKGHCHDGDRALDKLMGPRGLIQANISVGYKF
jgi:hypothetical protein